MIRRPRYSPPCTASECSLQCPQQPASSPCPKSNQVQILRPYLFKIHLNNILPPTFTLKLSHSGFRSKFCVHISALPCSISTVNTFPQTLITITDTGSVFAACCYNSTSKWKRGNDVRCGNVKIQDNEEDVISYWKVLQKPEDTLNRTRKH